MNGRSYFLSGNMCAIYFALIIGGLSLVSTMAGSSASELTTEEPKKIVYFGCGELYIIHCEPLPNILDSSLLPAVISKIYDVKTEPVEYTNGSFGKAFVVSDIQEGSDRDYILNNQLLNPPKVSISFWLKPQTGYRGGGHVISHVNSDNTAGWFFDTVINVTASNRTESLRFSVTNFNGTVFSTAPVPIYPNNFSYFVGTFDGDFVKLYVNGVLNSSVRYSGKYEPNPDRDITIGMNSFDHWSPWSGYLDDLRIYSIPLGSDMCWLFNDREYHLVIVYITTV